LYDSFALVSYICFSNFHILTMTNLKLVEKKKTV
jgi:hypothetical protein